MFYSEAVQSHVAACITTRYISIEMASKPVPVRFEPEIMALLQEGSRRTPFKKQELIRMTLRRHLASVIDSAATTKAVRLTNIKPWPEAELRKAYKRVGSEWDELEETATKAQGQPSLDD
jgi:hypothetical protein